MKIQRTGCLLLTLGICQLGAQSPQLPAFSDADIRMVAPDSRPLLIGVLPGSTRYELRGATLLDLIGIAWEVGPERIFGNMSWLGSDRYDVLAGVPADWRPESLRAMLQGLLAQQFQLVVHTEIRSVPAFALSVSKGRARIKTATSAEGAGCEPLPKSNTDTGSPPVVVFRCHGVTIPDFAGQLAEMAPGYIQGYRVVDQTKLGGQWDFTVKWTQRNQVASSPQDAISLADALERQLGLHLELTKAPLSAVVIDSATERSAKTEPTEDFPKATAEFDVAVVKASVPDALGTEVSFANGQVTIRNVSLKQLMLQAWNLPPDRLAELPAFADTNRYDILAKAPDGLNVGTEALRNMLRTLLIQRFRIRTHNEDRVVGVWALVASKSKLTAADPANRSDCQNLPTSSPLINRSIRCTNTTMDQFAAALGRMAGGYTTGKSVVNATGLDGAFDMNVNFSGIAVFQGAANLASAASDSGSASQPNGTISLFDALDHSLGLKLVSRKTPLPVLVVDHIESKPAAN